MIRLEPQSFDPHALLADFSRKAPGCGGIASFIGIVRPGEDDPVRALLLDHFPGVTERAISAAVEDARRRWPLSAVLIAHRVGEVKTGEPVVLVATAAAHRRPALEACDFLMDYLKTDAPFWKKEIRDSGAFWIEPRAEDYRDRLRWSPNGAS